MNQCLIISIFVYASCATFHFSLHRSIPFSIPFSIPPFITYSKINQSSARYNLQTLFRFAKDSLACWWQLFLLSIVAVLDCCCTNPLPHPFVNYTHLTPCQIFGCLFLQKTNYSLIVQNTIYALTWIISSWNGIPTVTMD